MRIQSIKLMTMLLKLASERGKVGRSLITFCR